MLFAYDQSYNADSSTPLDHTELLETNLWRLERLDMIAQNKPAPFRHLEGLLRDIYPINILTTPHLQREISGQKLRDWIENGAGRGYLQKIADHVSVWVLPPRNLPTVRNALARAGLLIAKLAK